MTVYITSWNRSHFCGMFCVLLLSLVGREVHDDQSYHVDVLKTFPVPLNLDGTQQTTYVSIQKSSTAKL